jgi:hypothetical protein
VERPKFVATLTWAARTQEGTFAMVSSIAAFTNFAIVMIAAGLWGLNRARSPDGAYLAATVGGIGVALLVSGLLLRAFM